MKVKNCTLIRALTCKKDDTVVEAAKTLKQNKQRRIIVVDDNESPVGIISTTDMNNRVVAEAKNMDGLKAEDIMTSPLYLVCDYEEGLGDIYEKMLKHKSYFVQVTKEGKIYGILTYGELVYNVKEAAKNA